MLIFYFIIAVVLFHCNVNVAFSALTLLVGWQEEHPTHENGMVICLERSANDLHMVQLMPLPPIIS